VPSALGAPNFAVSAFNIAMAFATFGSACAFPGLVMSVDVATKQPAARRPTRKLLRFIVSRLLYERRSWNEGSARLRRVHWSKEASCLGLVFPFPLSG